MDLFVTELLGYGDLQMKGEDLAIAFGYESLPFLALFGDDGDWWGNAVLPLDDEKFVSLTEKTLREVALNSAGIVKIAAAVKKDLEVITKNIPGVEVSSSVRLVSTDRVDISITINDSRTVFRYGPDAAGLPKGRLIYSKGVFTKEFTDEFS